MGVMKRLATARMFRYKHPEYIVEDQLPQYVWQGEYAVRLVGGKLKCSCPHFVMKLQFKKGEICKHAKQALANGHFKQIGGKYVNV